MQLGAYKTANQAERAWRSITRATGGLLDGLSRDVVEADLGLGRGFGYRLRAGPLPDRAAGERLCGELKSRGVGCFDGSAGRRSRLELLPPPPITAKTLQDGRGHAARSRPRVPSADTSRPVYQVQLGAYRSMARAQRAWREIMGTANGLLDELSREVIEVDLGAEKGIYFRARARGPSDPISGRRQAPLWRAGSLRASVASWRDRRKRAPNRPASRARTARR